MIEHRQPRQGKPPLRPVPPSFGKLHELDPVAVGVRKIAGDTPRRDHRRRVVDPGAVLRQPPVDGLDIIHLDGQVRRADRAALIARPLSGGGSGTGSTPGCAPPRRPESPTGDAPLVADHLVDARADALVLADQLQADHVAVEGNRPRAIANDESGVVQSSNHSHLPLLPEMQVRANSQRDRARVWQNPSMVSLGLSKALWSCPVLYSRQHSRQRDPCYTARSKVHRLGHFDHSRSDRLEHDVVCLIAGGRAK